MRNNNIKYIIFIITFIFIIHLISAENQILESYYSYYNNTSEFHSADFSSFLMKIYTSEDSKCKYAVSPGQKYNDMSGVFEYDYGTLHEKNFLELEDGLYKYYIKCKNLSMDNGFEPAELEFILRIDSLVNGEIVLSPESPLKSGNVEVNLLLSKIISKTPLLSYSFDGISYNKISLFGNEKNWKGYIIIPSDLGNAVGSFKLTAIDLEGRTGEQIIKGGVFMVDTIKPKSLSYINAIGENSQIKLDWYSDEDLKMFKIYRSLSPNPDYTNFYKTADKSPFVDNIVERGKTYYYRVSGIDKAGNEGELSREIYATALIDNFSSQSSGLNPSLIGSVDSLIFDIDSIFSDIQNIDSSVSTKTEKEKNLFIDLGLNSNIDDAKLKLNSLKNDIIKYKSQDLTKNELDNKLDSARLKLNIIKKDIPEDLTIISQDSREEDLSQVKIEESLLEINSSIPEEQKKKEVKDSLDLIKSSGLKIKSNFYICQTLYLDGTKKDFSFVEHIIDSQLEKSDNAYFYENIPKSIAESATEISFINEDYNVIKDDPIFSFGQDNKKIAYSLNKKVSLNSLKDIKIALITLSENNKDTNQGITGYSVLYNLKNFSGIGIIIIIFLACLFFYFYYIKMRSFSEDFFIMDKGIDEAFDYLRKKDIRKAEEIYNSLNHLYKRLNKSEKLKAYTILESLKNKIIEDYENQRKLL